MNNDINNKCMNIDHNYDIEFYCESCNDIPICKLCIPIHKGHSINIFNIDKKESIKNEFISSLDKYKNEIEFLNNELKLLEDHFNHSLSESNNNIKIINEKFKLLHQKLQLDEYNLIRQIKTINEENYDSYIIKRSLIENKIQLLDTIINKYEFINLDQNSDDYIHQYVEIIKFNHQINILNIQLPSFNYIIQPFKYFYITDSGQNKNDIDNQFINLISINIINKFKCNLFFDIFINDNSFILLNNSNNDIPVQCGNNYNCSVSSESGLPLAIPKCNCLLCLDVKSIPNYNIYDTVQTLLLLNINDILKIGSIPIVHHLYINGYNNSLPKGVIPYGVEELTLSNINYNFKDIYIPSSVQILRLNNINNEIESIPKSIKRLGLYNVKIKVNSIPSSVKYLKLGQGFKQKVIKGLIPNELDSLFLGDIEHPIDDSLPFISNIHIHNGYKHKLNQSVIPSSVQSIHLYDIEHELDNESLPSSLYSLYIHDRFKYHLYKHIIADGIQELHIYNIEQPLLVESIPQSVKYLYIHDGYKYKINNNMISSGVESLSIYNIEQPLDIKSIPSSVKHLYIHNGYRYSLNKGIISEGIESLSISNIEQPLIQGSIPQSVRYLYIQDSYRYKLNNSIIPYGVTHLIINFDYEHIKDISIPLSIQYIIIQDENINISHDILKKYSYLNKVYINKDQINTIDLSSYTDSIIIIIK